MRWPWTKRDDRCGDGAKAREDAAAVVREVHARAPQVERTTERLRELREANHFAQLILETVRRAS